MDSLEELVLIFSRHRYSAVLLNSVFELSFYFQLLYQWLEISGQILTVSVISSLALAVTEKICPVYLLVLFLQRLLVWLKKSSLSS